MTIIHKGELTNIIKKYLFINTISLIF